MKSGFKKLYYLFFGMFFLLFTLSGCYSYRNKPIYETRKKPVKYKETVKKQVPFNYKVPKYELRPPYFPNITNRNVNIAVLPFTTSSGAANVTGSGVEISNELEFRLMKQAEKFQKMNKRKIKIEFDRATGEYCVDEGIFDEWYLKNRINKYQILSRDRLNAILTEKDIKDTSVNVESIQRNAKLIGVDCLITGHLRSLGASDTSFIMKAIIPDTGKVVFYERYEGSYETAFNDAIETFFFNIKKAETTCTKVRYETKSEVVQKTRYESERVKVGTERVRYHDKKKEEIWGYIALGIIILLVI
ncbi:hypothetical protein ACFL2E_01335 [Thermodesulfobacteriota bacterium]